MDNFAKLKEGNEDFEYFSNPLALKIMGDMQTVLTLGQYQEIKA